MTRERVTASFLKKAVDHYDRMIAWAKTRPENEMVFRKRMRNAIKEDWYGEYCPMCLSVQGDCSECCLSGEFRLEHFREVRAFLLLEWIRETRSCCGMRGEYMSNANTWGQWIPRARIVRDHIERVLLRLKQEHPGIERNEEIDDLPQEESHE